VNLFIASELHWPEKGLVLKQLTRFPEQPGTSLQFTAEKPVELTLWVRIPSWATNGVSLKLNGTPLVGEGSGRPASFTDIHRTWQTGDRIEIEMPMALHLQPMPDDKNRAAIMYGPLVLAGRMGDLTPEEMNDHNTAPGGNPVAVPELVAKGKELRDWIKPIPGRPLEFRTQGQKTDVTLVPFNALFKQRYAVYWTIHAQ
jgi:DUF1680 family protein